MERSCAATPTLLLLIYYPPSVPVLGPVLPVPVLGPVLPVPVLGPVLSILALVYVQVVRCARVCWCEVWRCVGFVLRRRC